MKFKKVFMPVLIGLLTGSMNAMANGGGYNGPTLEPIAIQMGEDQGVEHSLIRATVDECLLNYSDNPNRKTVMAQLFEQIFGFAPSGSRRAMYPNNLFAGGNVTGGGFLGIGRKILGIYTLIGSDDNTYIEANSVEGDRLGLFMQDQALPHLVWGKTIEDLNIQYDHLGRVVFDKSRVLLRDLALQLPNGWDASKPKFYAKPLLNSHTGKPTPFTLNAVDYAECLRTEAAKLPVTTKGLW